MMLNLELNKWYSWQMLPGYTVEPYYSPIKILNSCNLSSDLIELSFYNACYAQGVRTFSCSLQKLWHHENYLIAKINPDESSYTDRIAIIGKVDFFWLKKHLNIDNLDRSMNIEKYLDNYFS